MQRRKTDLQPSGLSLRSCSRALLPKSAGPRLRDAIAAACGQASAAAGAHASPSASAHSSARNLLIASALIAPAGAYAQVTVNPPANLTVTEGTTATIQVPFADSEQSAWGTTAIVQLTQSSTAFGTFTCTLNPAFGSCTDPIGSAGAGNAIVSFAAQPALGTASARITIGDEFGSASAIGTISVQVVPKALTASSFQVTALSRTPLPENLLPNEVTYDTAVLSSTNLAVTLTQPGHGKAVLSGGTTITYEPSGNYVGTDTVPYSVTDGYTTQAATMTVVVTPQTPTAVTSFTVTTNDKTAKTADLSTQVTFDPADPPASRHITIGAASHGTATLTGTTVTYTPNDAFLGNDTVPFQATDGYTSANGTMTVTVNPQPITVNAAIAVADAFNTPAPVNLANYGLTVDPLVPAANVHTSLTAQPAHGTATVAGNAITYTPTTGYAGADTIPFQVTDGYTTASGTITVTVGDPTGLTASPAVATTNDKTAVPVSLASDVTFPGSVPAANDIITVTAPAHGTATVAGTTVTYTPNDKYLGTDVINYQATDGYTTAASTITVTVNPQPIAVNAAIAVADAFNTAAPVNLANYGLTFDPLVPTANVHTSLTAQPAHGTATVAGNVITYTPTTGYAGADTIPFQVTDGYTTASGTITVTVGDPTTPTVIPASATTNDKTAVPINLASDVTFPTTVPATNDKITVTAPAHGTATVAGTTVTYTPNDKFLGTDVFNYQATDGYTTATSTITVTVNPQPIKVSGAIAVADAFNTPAPVNLANYGLTFDPLVPAANVHTSLTAQPAHGTATVAGNVITYTPTTGFAGADTIPFQVTDGYTTASGTITVTVGDPTGLTASPAVATTNDKTAVPVNLASDVTFPGSVPGAKDTITVTAPAHGTATVAGTTVTYTPNDKFIGTDVFNYQATDGYTTAASTITVTVNPQPIAVNAAIAVGDAFNTAAPVNLANYGLTVDPLVPAANVRTSLTAQPAHGTATVAGNVITYTPTTGYAGADTIPFQVTDGYTTASGTITVTVADPTGLTASPAVATTNDTTAVQIKLATDVMFPTSVPGAKDTIAVAAPAHGTATVAGTTVTYTPNDKFLGTDVFNYQATDGYTTAVSTITVTVNPQPIKVTGAIAVGDAFDTPAVVNLAQNGLTVDPLVPAANVRTSLTAQPAHGTATVAGNSITYTPATSYAGVDTIPFQVTDGYTTANGTITVTVGDPTGLTAKPASATTIDTVPVPINLATDVTFPASVPGAKDTITVAAPAHGTATVSGTTVTYTPNDKYLGTDVFNYQATDGYTTASSTVTVTVNPQTIKLTAPKLVTDTFNMPAVVSLSPYLTVDPLVPASNVRTSLTGQPPHGTATVAGNSITYTPTTGYAGPDTIAFQVTDGYTTASGTVPVTVNKPGLNLTTTASANATYGVAAPINLASFVTDSAFAASALKYTISTPPMHGTASIAGSLLTYTAAKGYVGPDSVGYSVTDGYSTGTGRVSIQVQAPRVAIPTNIIGMPQAAALAALKAAGLTATPIYVVSGQHYGSVVSTTPAAGTIVSVGSTITVAISEGAGLASNPSAPISSVSGLTNAEQSVARGLENSCNAISAAQGRGTALTAQQQNFLTACNSVIQDYGGGTKLAALKGALDSISGRQATAPQQMGILFTGGQLANVGNRLTELHQGAQGISLTGLDLGMPGGATEVLAPMMSMLKDLVGGGAGDAPSVIGNRLGIFANGTLTRGSQSSTDNVDGFDLKGSGFTIGADYRFTNHLILGVAAGFDKTISDFSDGSGQADAKSTMGTIYGTYTFKDAYVDAIGSVGHNSYQSVRNINLGVGCIGAACTATTQGDTGARQYGLGLDGGYNFHDGAATFGPQVSIDYMNIAVHAFDENGPSGLDLSFGDQTARSLRLKLGGSASYAISTKYFVMLPQIRAQAVHEFNNDGQSVNARFLADVFSPSAGADSGTFQVFTDRPDRNFFEYNASLVFQFPYDISGYVDYGSVAGLQNVSSHTFSIGIRVQPGARR